MKAAALAVLALLLVSVTACGSGSKRAVSHSGTTRTASVRPKPMPKPKPRYVTPHRKPVPILNYHVIGDPPAGAPFPELYVSRGAFASQLRWLRAHGYHAVSLRRVYDYWLRGLALPPRPIVLSFDDGYLGQFTNARPLLQRYHWAGVLNLAVQNVLDRKLTVGDLRTMVRDGWEVDAHSLTHPDLTTLDHAELRHQVAGSRNWIRRKLGVPVAFFCYPAGRYDAAVVAAVRAAGFLGATTTNQGPASRSNGLFTLDRIRVDRSDGLSVFAAKVGWS